MDHEYELERIAKVYGTGVDVLEKIKDVLTKVDHYGFCFKEVNRRTGELTFYFSGIALYCKVKVANETLPRILWGRCLREGTSRVAEKPVVESKLEFAPQPWEKRMRIDYEDEQGKPQKDFLDDDSGKALLHIIWKIIAQFPPETLWGVLH